MSLPKTLTLSMNMSSCGSLELSADSNPVAIVGGYIPTSTLTSFPLRRNKSAGDSEFGGPSAIDGDYDELLLREKHQLHCLADWDGILCWPQTLAGDTITLPCMEKLHGIPYNTSGLVTRACASDGVWTKAHYLGCEHLLTNLTNATSEGTHLDVTTGVYFFGYCLSLTALLCAAFIFIAFKELRCLRNTIHSHLIITYILADALWVFGLISELVVSSQSQMERGTGRAACVTFILLHYFCLTNFFWMFVEGLYLYVLVVQTFMAENIKLRTYCFLGWGIPLIVVSLWCIIRWFTMELEIGLPEHTGPLYTGLLEVDQNLRPCPWLYENVYDWIYKSSALFVLAANMLFLLQIMWVLITKLRSQTTPETQQSRKAAKALVVLMPLLGITYVLILIGSRKVPVFEHTRAFLISTQGFLVALFYCFLNQEVRQALRHRWARIRNFGPDCPCCGCDNERQQNAHQMRDWSPRSRTESIRMYTPTGNSFRKRESSTSESTTMTALLGNYNGSSAGQGHSIVMTTTGRKSIVSSSPMHSCKSSNLTMHEDIVLV